MKMVFVSLILLLSFGMAKSTICTILKNRETIKKADFARGVTVITKQRSLRIEEEVKNLCTKCCCKSLNKQSSGIRGRFNPFYINSYGEYNFGLRTFRFTNDLQERIKYVNRGLTVHCFVGQVLVMGEAVLRYVEIRRDRRAGAKSHCHLRRVCPSVRRVSPNGCAPQFILGIFFLFVTSTHSNFR